MSTAGTEYRRPGAGRQRGVALGFSVGGPRMRGRLERRGGAPRGPDGWLRNPWPDSELAGWRDVLRFLTGSRLRARAPAPPRGSFPTAIPAIAYPRAGETDFTATWIGHSTVLLQIGGRDLPPRPALRQ